MKSLSSLLLASLFTLLLSIHLEAQEQLGYQKPPPEILDLVDIERAPSVRMDNKKDFMVLLYRDTYKTISELSQEELRLGGLRIDPKNNIGSRVTYSNNLRVQSLKASSDKGLTQVQGLPAQARMTSFTWSPDQSMMAFTNTTDRGVELWILDIKAATASKISEANINANLGDVINWFADGKSLLVKKISVQKSDLIDTKLVIPTGPTITVADGKKAQNRTYQDLLKNKNDEHNFEQLALSELHQVYLDGTSSLWLPSAMYRNVSFSPDGEYVMISTVERPFSYLVPYRRFASKRIIYNKNGKSLKTLSELPVIEDLPKGFMSCIAQPRSYSWRSDKPATLVYAQALDGGDPAVDVEYRDELFLLSAPFDKATSLLKLKNRYYNIEWGDDNCAIASDYWWNDRNTKSYIFNPSDNTQLPVTLYDRNYQDRYNDPGNFVYKRNELGRYVLAMEGNEVYLLGDGHTEEGQFPYLDRLDLSTKDTKRVYQSTYTDKLENLYDFDPANKQLLVSIESSSE